jgi:primosomal protein N' (replication factor Y)
MQEFRFAEVLLPLAIKNTLTYSIPEELADNVKPGFRVVVILGKRKMYSGIVTLVHNNQPDFECKPIYSAIDSQALFCDKQFDFLNWISEYYCCTKGEVLDAAIPSVLLPSGETKVWYNIDFATDYSPNSSEIKILNFLQNSPNTDIYNIASAVGIKNPIAHLENLERNGILFLSQNLKDTYKPVYKNVIVFKISLIETYSEECSKILKRNSKQKEVLQFLNDKCLIEAKDIFECDEKWLMQHINVSKTTLYTLIDKHLLEVKKIEVSRFVSETNSLDNNLQLSDNQLNVYNQILNNFNCEKPVLLHGVTSSGKTEVYIKLIEKVISAGKEVLYLLPEIALTAQMIKRLQNYFGDKIGIFHSKYPISARSEVYLKVSQQKLKIVLGVRSAIFLPFTNLGLIIVDEEHESTIKQNDPDPRYNARDAAVVLSKIHSAEVVLGSATPSLESYHNALSSKYLLTELNERYGNVEMPEIVVADLKDAYRRKIMNGHFHPILVSEITDAIKNKKQIILFQNRRGYSPFLECTSCGWVPYCSACNVSLTYHKFRNRLECHYCGENHPVVSKCPVCGSDKLNHKGFGTEKIEDETAEIFPEARIVRLDFDTAGTRGKFSKIINDFAEYKYDVLVGTQMVTKGLDFERLGLVGVLNADNLLNHPDFRAYERAFQLLTQVSGRAGRRDTRGKVIIQTYDKENPIISFVKNDSYAGMYNSQIAEREQFKYPPFWNFIILKLKHKDKNRLRRAANALADMLRNELQTRVTGPEEPLVSKISNYYILNIHIRYEKKFSAAKVRNFVLSKIDNLKSEGDFSSVKIEVDVDPM